MLLKHTRATQATMLAVLAVCVVSINACTNRSQTNTDSTPVLSRQPSTTFAMPPLSAHPEIGWVLSDGSRVQLADHQGKVLVLDFYATWCQPCRRSIPKLMALQSKFGANGLQVVGLNVGGADDRIKVSNFAKELGIQYPLGFPDQALSDLFLHDNQTIPQTFVFGRNGELQRRFIGYDLAAEDELEKAIEGAVKEEGRQ